MPVFLVVRQIGFVLVVPVLRSPGIWIGVSTNEGDGTPHYLRGVPIMTIGELKRIMQDLPDETPVRVFSDSMDSYVDFDIAARKDDSGRNTLEVSAFD